MAAGDNKVSVLDISLEEKTGVFRDPIHGLVTVYPWERALIDTSEFQRLRRIHQLSMTYLVYHGAEHTRFGHSIGVMHIAGRVMDHLRNFSPLAELSEEEFFEKKALVRMAGLLHDVGHGCYSHVGEEENSIYPNLKDPINGEMVIGHEAYTRCIVKERLSEIIEKFWPREKYHMVEDILLILSQSSIDPVFRFFDDIISGQLDCDKMDYLLRDSHYCGVEYGTYDLDKLIHSLRVVEIEGNYVLGIIQSGIQAVEEFVLARYWMFIQVYFHKDRRLFDYYLSSFMKEYLTLEIDKSGQYPVNLEYYLDLDDSKIDSAIQKYARCRQDKETQRICYFAERLFLRRHHKVAFNPPYVHYNLESGEEQEAYKRISFVRKHIKEKLEGVEALHVYVDLAEGSATKHSFHIRVYNEEQSPDMQIEDLDKRLLLPAIPVISKHNGSVDPIQDYSFTLRSISDRKIGILRVYAEEEIVDEIKNRCQCLFTKEYDEHKERLRKLEKEVEEDQRKLREKQERLNVMKKDL